MANPRPKTLNFITGNANKLAEVRAILDGVGGVELHSAALDLVEIQGSSEEIARDKCARAAVAVNGPVLTEDTALEFNALKGLPGPYIKWFLDALGHTGLNNLLSAYEDKSASAVCTFAFSAGPGHEPILFQGRTPGKIVPPRGPANFGWDPIFEYEGQTYAEMDKVAKVGLSIFQLLWRAGTSRPPGKVIDPPAEPNIAPLCSACKVESVAGRY